MAAGSDNLDLDSQHTDLSPLLMAQPSSVEHEHIVNICSTSNPFVPSIAAVENGALFQRSSSQSVAQQEDPPSGEALSRSLSASSSLRGQPSFPSTTASNSTIRPVQSNSYGVRQRSSPLNSGLWITIELTITVSQIVASIIVLSLSRDEKPQAPLSVWVAGYAAGCLATLPLLYWRFRHRYVGLHEQDPLSSSVASPPTPVGVSGSTSYVSLTPGSQDEESQGERQTGLDGQDPGSENRVGTLVERFKIALDGFFAIWFVVGNVWIFGGHSSSSEAPNLYRLCIVFLTFSCIGYAMPFILCATICCCLPCIIALLGFHEDHIQGRGASVEVIAALPTYKFKAKTPNEMKVNKDGNESDCEGGAAEGGLVAAGTEMERLVSADDAVCCICLGKYKDDVELRELPCTHHFHVECVDKWLNINASCPLCKHDVGGSAATNEGTLTEQSNELRERQEPAEGVVPAS